MDAPVRFDEWMARALYGPAGFYTGAGRAGRRGDFITSPEVGPLFAAVLARAVDAEWERLGRPDHFCLVEAGAGPGTLARGVLAAKPAVLAAGALDYVCVEVGESQRASHPAGVTSRADVPDEAVVGMIVANELLDNVPFRLAVWDGEWMEAHVADAHGRSVEVLLPFDEMPACLPRGNVALGSRAPVQQQAGEWVRQARTLLTAGKVVVIDYCSPTTAGLSMRPWREWLRTYRQHERGGHYLATPGEQDITTEVCIDQLVSAAGEPDAVRSQAQWLQYWGIDDLVVEGKQWWEAKAHAPDLQAIKGRSRVSEAEALLDPSGLGSFTVLEWLVGDG